MIRDRSIRKEKRLHGLLPILHKLSVKNDFNRSLRSIRDNYLSKLMIERMETIRNSYLKPESFVKPFKFRQRNFRTDVASSGRTYRLKP
ncbi:hypothetical protein DTL21_28895 [Bremerella cremea]|uniref:Uncharacterized protein n=1 Tax=Blastopirellula marina TaxID=124 RepID=A0A2S8F8X7_9BACT|nr:hypothetical protein C5Y83_28845 [Blastopirellula marina]RCS41982.1 hypothetical protein DTL21_28895 [Bremerella cremea]